MEVKRRKIVAIMFTDMVGYTSLTQQNESLALALLERQRKIVRYFLAKHGGKEVKTIGDAFLIVFGSATDAVQCASAIQKRMSELGTKKNRQSPLLSLRIGIHMGEVIEEDGDIYGDSVNIASRIVDQADEGGICITQTVWDQVKNKFSNDFLRTEETKLKNIASKIQLYRFEARKENIVNEARVSLSKAKRDYVRVAVLPLTDLSGRRTDTFFADGLTDELISALSRIKELRVIARTSVIKYKTEIKSAKEIGRELDVDYLVEGSIRKFQNRILCQVQLVDVVTEESIWTQSYKRELKNILETQAEIAGKVCTALKSKVDLPLALQFPQVSNRPENLNAFTLYLKGRYFWNRRDLKSIKKAIRLFGMSIDEDKNYAKAYSGLSDCYIILGNYMLSNNKESFANAMKYAKRAIQLDPRLAEAHASLAAVLASYYFNFKEAEKEMIQAISLNPSYATAHGWHADILIALGKLDEAMKELEIAHMLDPFSDIILTGLAMCHLYMKDFDEAVKYCQQVIKRSPKFYIAYNALGECYLQIGKLEKAIEQYLKALSINKDDGITLAYLAHVYFLAGEKDAGYEVMKKIEKVAREPELSCLLGAVYSAFDVEMALKCIRKALRERTLIVDDLLYSPIYSLVRNNHRFPQLVSEVVKR